MEGKFYDTNNHYSHQILTYGTRALHFSLNTIINTGRKEIRPGDVISLGLPHQFKWEDDPYNKSKQAEGIPLDKLLFSTDVVTPSSEAEKVEEIVAAYRETTNEVRNAMNDSMMPVALRTLKEYTDDGRDLGDINNPRNKVRRQKAYHVITSIMHANRKMIIGKALSFARPGEPFDICLGGSNSL